MPSSPKSPPSVSPKEGYIHEVPGSVPIEEGAQAKIPGEGEGGARWTARWTARRRELVEGTIREMIRVC